MVLKFLKLMHLKSVRNGGRSEIVKNNAWWKSVSYSLDAETESLCTKQNFAHHLIKNFLSLFRDLRPHNKDFVTPTEDVIPLIKNFTLRNILPMTEDFLSLTKTKPEFLHERLNSIFINKLLVSKYWQISYDSQYKNFVHSLQRNSLKCSANPIRDFITIS